MTELRLAWRPSGLQRRLVTVAAFALLGAVAFGLPQLVVLATPVVWAPLAGPLRRAPGTLRVEVSRDAQRGFEGEQVSVDAVIHLDAQIDHIAVVLDPSPGFVVPAEAARCGAAGSARLHATWTLAAERSAGAPLARLPYGCGPQAACWTPRLSCGCPRRRCSHVRRSNGSWCRPCSPTGSVST